MGNKISIPKMTKKHKIKTLLVDRIAVHDYYIEILSSDGDLYAGILNRTDEIHKNRLLASIYHGAKIYVQYRKAPSIVDYYKHKTKYNFPGRPDCPLWESKYIVNKIYYANKWRFV